MDHYRVVVADDQQIVRQMVNEIIGDSSGLKMVGEARDGIELLNLLKAVPAELAIVDLSMPRLNGLKAIRQIKLEYKELKVLVLTAHKAREYLVAAMRSGADGFLLKDYMNEELLSAVDVIRGNGLFVSKIISVDQGSVCAIPYLDQRPGLKLLTPREIEILCLVSSGKSSREIAEMLHLSEVTVKNHRSHIKKKLRIRRNAELIGFALRNDLLSIHSPQAANTGKNGPDPS